MSEQPRHALDSVFRPRSVAVVGASADPTKRGNQVLAALSAAGFEGDVYPVNPRGGEIHGYAVFPSVAELPQAPDLALICLPAGAVPDAVEACGARGAGAAVVLAVGFGESGPEGEALANNLLGAARRHGVRVVGPNTSGLLNLPLGLNLIGARGVRPGGLSLAVQSGNIALSFMTEVTARSRDGVAICVGVGNELDLGFDEYVDYLGQHEETRAIVMYSEGLRRGRDFLEVAARVSRAKPVLLLKGARSESGQAAARSHTGAVAGEYDRLRAGLKQAGVVEVMRSDELVHLAETLANQPAVREGRGVAILSDGGGQGTLAADALSDLGVPLARLGEATARSLRELLGRAAAVGNPVDLAGAADADPEVFGHALELLAGDDAVGGVLLVGLFGGYGIRFADSLAEGEVAAARQMSACMERAGKPLVVHSMYASRWAEPLEILAAERVPIVESLDIAVRCMAETWRRGVFLDGPMWVGARTDLGDPGEPSRGAPATDRSSAGAIPSALAEGRDTLTEPEAASLLEAHGLPFPRAIACRTETEAVAAAETLGGRLVLKAISPRIPHKTDAGGVELDVAATDVVPAWNRIHEATSAHLERLGLEPGLEGVLISPMLSTPLAELLVGASRDPVLGPVLTVGAGGVWVEMMADVTHRVLPVDDADIRRMLTELQAYGLLTGARGRPLAPLDSIVAAVRSVADCVLHHEEIADVEVNPLFVFPDSVVAVDARVFLGGSS